MDSHIISATSVRPQVVALMSDKTSPTVFLPSRFGRMARKIGLGGWLGVSVLVGGLSYVAFHVISDLAVTGTALSFPFMLLALSLLVALGFEFVNGFHDTANAVATVIYTNSMSPVVAVVWSGLFNLLGVLASSGAVAFTIVSLLPVELILQVGTTSGFAMVYALLLAALIWNLGTWYFGIPSSSSHTLIGSIVGVGLMNQFLSGPSGTSGVDWSQVVAVGRALILSPCIGFTLAALLLLLCKMLVPSPKLYRAPEGSEPPPSWIRAILIFTCTGVSFAHGSNDGQKGMGLIMLILIGTVPTAYALNHAVKEADVAAFQRATEEAMLVIHRPDEPRPDSQSVARTTLTDYLRTRSFSRAVLPAIELLSGEISKSVGTYRSLAKVPAEEVANVRNDMYLVGESIRLLQTQGLLALTPDQQAALVSFKQALDQATKFIPPWVKVATAIALGMGTMIGWKRIVVTVGERIGKEHLTYAQGASAEFVAMSTISAAEQFGLPISTTHTLSSAVAGTMAANRSGLQTDTVRNILLTWLLTLPVSITLSGLLFFFLRSVV
jgi:inorganic phosphate transporter, PiT family